MQLALIDDQGNVINVIEANEGFDPDAGVKAILATGGVGPGWRWQDDVFQPPANKQEHALKVSDLQFRRASSILESVREVHLGLHSFLSISRIDERCRKARAF